MIFTIFCKPSDYPDKIVVTKDTILPGRTVRDGHKCLFDSVTEAREALLHCYPGLTRLTRAPEDPPSIVETWL